MTCSCLSEAKGMTKNMNKISEVTRQDIIDIIREGFTVILDEEEYDDKSDEYVTERTIKMPYYGRLDEIDFLSRVYNLKELPSHDSRYKNALDDISCHLRWDDYEEECWFFQDERFKLQQKDGDEPLLRFICEMVHPAVRREKSPWKQYLDKFNELLRVDGYELYPAHHISGRDIYKAREYSVPDKPLLPDNLFSERYKDLIDYGHGEAVDNISNNIDYRAKKHICRIMQNFREPIQYQPNRYHNWTEKTNALDVAINRLNEFMDTPVIDLKSAMFSLSSEEEIFANYFTPFIFDVIEFQYDELSEGEKCGFQEEINASLQKDNVSFRLIDRGLIEQLPDHEVLTSELISMTEQIKEPGLRELFDIAVEKHMQPSSQSHKDAVEKIWGVLERLKTYYTGLDKKKSVERIINDMAGGQEDFVKLFDTEFKALTDIGNSFRIRHHETDRTDITDIRYYDYFFNRCLSLIALAIQYLE